MAFPPSKKSGQVYRGCGLFAESYLFKHNDLHKRLRFRALIDEDGYRPNVGIVVANGAGQVLWARRVGQDAWQFPQGGIKSSESPVQALYRELEEEIGLQPKHVEIVGKTRGWLRYRLPKRLLRNNNSPFVGQKQKWFLLKMLGGDDAVKFDGSLTPEFDTWQWVSYWYPLGQVVSFKQDVYRRAMKELAPALSKCIS
ncbi:MAG: putative (di)nucleoside polyphosphate hydrolase [Candidatus Azotimanducaceae bacterium]|jgi:putative (di)nucleoside polyphosphate hydrolase